MITKSFISQQFDSLEAFDAAIGAFGTELESQGYEIQVTTHFHPIVMQGAVPGLVVGKVGPSQMIINPMILREVTGFKIQEDDYDFEKDDAAHDALKGK